MIDDLRGHKFLHSINLKDATHCHNFAIPSPLYSVVAANLLLFGKPLPTPLYSCSIEDLYLNPDRCLTGVGSPCFRVIVLASYIRKGLDIITGLGKKIEYSDLEKEELLFKADLEIAFERVRRKKFNSKPSRLSSIFVVEDNDEGKFCLGQMFYKGLRDGRYTPHVLQVKTEITIAFHKGDIQWLDKYVENEDEEQKIFMIEQYWKGEAFNRLPIYEYFLEGIILPSKRCQIEILRREGVFYQGEDGKHWKDLKGAEYETWFVD